MLNTTWKLSLAVLTAITVGLTATAAQAQFLQEYWDFEDGTIGGTNTSIGLKNGTGATPDAGTTATYGSAADSPLTGNSVAAYFDVEQDRFRTNPEDVTFLDGQSTFTLSAWIKPTAFNDRHMFLTKDQSFEWGVSDQNGTGDIAFMLRINNNGPGGESPALRNIGTQDVTFLADNNWHHVAVTYDANSTVNYYIDGGLHESIAAATDFGDQSILIPADTDNTFGFGDRPNEPADDQGYTGYIDEIAIFTGLLTPGQISDLANGDATPLTVPEPSSFLLAGLGVVGLALLGRRRRIRRKVAS